MFVLCVAKLENQQSASFQIEKKKVNEDGDDDKEEEEVGRKSLENIVDFCMRVCVCVCFPFSLCCFLSLFLSHSAAGFTFFCRSSFFSRNMYVCIHVRCLLCVLVPRSFCSFALSLVRSFVSFVWSYVSLLLSCVSVCEILRVCMWCVCFGL